MEEKKAKRPVRIFDTTLRDGEQSPGCSMTTKEKLEMARALERLGVDVIEAGFAASSPDDFNAVRKIARTVKRCRVCSLARAAKEDIDRAAEAVRDAAHPMIHVFLATSPIHMEHKLKMTPDEVVRQAGGMVRYARSFCDEVEFSCEDASRSELPFLARVCSAAIGAGATVINLPDTVGYATPQEVFNMISYVRENASGAKDVILSTHCHDDLGLATANTVSAVMAGASQVEVTAGGIGERAGNASLEEVVMLLKTRADACGVSCGVNTREIYRTCRLLSAITGVPISPTKPVVGANAFAHEAGIHQHGVLCNPSTYEIMRPEDIGIPKNRMVLGKHSGKHAFGVRVRDMGYELTEAQLAEAFARFKELADKKKSVADGDIEAIVTRSVAGGDGDKYTLERFSVSCGTGAPPKAAVRISHCGVTEEAEGGGDGPIDALFFAVDRIVKGRYALEDYTVHAVSSGGEAVGTVTVKLSAGGETYTGTDISTDIVEASLKAYLNGINKLHEAKGAM